MRPGRSFCFGVAVGSFVQFCNYSFTDWKDNAGTFTDVRSEIWLATATILFFIALLSKD